MIFVCISYVSRQKRLNGRFYRIITLRRNPIWPPFWWWKIYTLVKNLHNFPNKRRKVTILVFIPTFQVTSKFNRRFFSIVTYLRNPKKCKMAAILMKNRKFMNSEMMNSVKTSSQQAVLTIQHVWKKESLRRKFHGEPSCHKLSYH